MGESPESRFVCLQTTNFVPSLLSLFAVELPEGFLLDLQVDAFLLHNI